MEDTNLTELRKWIGNTEKVDDVITLSPMNRMAATLDKDETFQEGDLLPPSWHWIFFVPQFKTSNAGPDGHERRGEFIPPITLPRRMWAGSRIEFLKPLKVGQSGTRKSEIAGVTVKEGKTGQLIFVLVRHEISGPNGLALVEEQDLVYREAPKPDDPKPRPKPAATEADCSREILPTPVLLFRYSALTFNAHKIHYNHIHCAEEGYPSPVVHGALTATFLLDMLRDQMPQAQVKKFSFRAVSPLFADDPFTIYGKANGNEINLWAANHEGNLAVEANALLAT